MAGLFFVGSGVLLWRGQGRVAPQSWGRVDSVGGFGLGCCCGMVRRVVRVGFLRLSEGGRVGLLLWRRSGRLCRRVRVWVAFVAWYG